MKEILPFTFPGLIEQEILDIGTRQISYMRTKEFSDLVLESQYLLNRFLDNDEGKVIIYTASGTAAMESAVCNYVSQFERKLVINGGTFGKRWKEICDYYQFACDVFHVEFGKDIDYNKLENEIKKNKYEVLLCQHHETSSGQLFNMDIISEICRKHTVSLVVDAISSFLADPFSMKKWNIDVAVLSSQKGLNLPPGLSMLFLSAKALRTGFTGRNFYLDITENLSNLKRGQTPYSPATTLFMQLHSRLRKLEKDGVEITLKKVKDNAVYFRKICKEMTWKLSAEIPSSCITGFYVDGGRKISELLVNEGIYVMPSGDEQLLRISHIGLQGKAEIDLLVNEIINLEKNHK